MSLITEDAFSKMLKKEIEGNIFLIWGDDDYLKEYYCDLLVKKTVEPDLQVFNFHKYEDDAEDLDIIFADAENLPVMCEKTCLLVKNYSLDSMGTNQLKEFGEKLKNIPETTVIIFYFSSSKIPAGKNAKWDTVTNLFMSIGTAVKLEHRTPQKTAKLLVSRAKDRGTEIDFDTAIYLIDVAGDDLSTLLNEFNKICAFSEGQPITKEMIDFTATKSVEASVFDISTSIFSGNTDNAFMILNELLRQKTPASSIIGALANAYVNVYRLKVALNCEKNIQDFASEFQYKETKYQFGKIAPFARKNTLSSIRKALDILSEADVKSKSQRISEEMLLTELISKLASCSE